MRGSSLTLSSLSFPFPSTFSRVFKVSMEGRIPSCLVSSRALLKVGYFEEGGGRVAGEAISPKLKWDGGKRGGGGSLEELVTLLSAWFPCCCCCCCCCWPHLFWPLCLPLGRRPPLPPRESYCCCWLKGVSLGPHCTPEIAFAFFWGRVTRPPPLFL